MFRRRQTDNRATLGAEETAPGEQSSPGLARVLERIRKNDGRAEILDLGSLCGPTAVALASTGARVCVEEFVPPPSIPTGSKDGDEVAPEPVELPHSDDRFDLILVWEHFDFVPPQRLSEFAAEIGRVLVPGGSVVFFAKDAPSLKPGTPERPGQYLLTGDDRVVRSPSAGETRPRWTHPNRAIERALKPLAVEGIHLQKNRMREILAQKKRAS